MYDEADVQLHEQASEYLSYGDIDPQSSSAVAYAMQNLPKTSDNHLSRNPVPTKVGVKHLHAKLEALPKT